MNANLVFTAAVQLLLLLLAVSVHGAAQARAAELCGDPTASQLGAASLNPLRHFDLLGSLLFPALLLAFGFPVPVFGWGRPIPVVDANLHRPGWDAILVAAAGPAANLLIALVVFGTLKLLLGVGLFVAPDHADFNQVVSPSPGAAPGSWAWPAAFCLSVALNLNVLLFLFNLIPLPPLDGAGILHGLLPGSLGGPFGALARNPGLSLAGLLVAWRLFDLVYPGAFSLLLALLHPGITYR